MPKRNFLILLAAAFISLACYKVASRNRYATTLTSAMNIITSEYIDEVEPRILFEGAMVGMIDKLDPYSGYVSPEEFQQFQQEIDGEFEGVGIVIEEEEGQGLKVVDALVGKPAYEAGIRAGDIILAIDGRELKDIPLHEAVGLIRGRPGSTVNMLVQHASGGSPKEYTLLRAKIPLQSVLGDARRDDGTWVYRFVDYPNIGFIRITSFGERTADELRRALASYQQPGEEIEGLVIDLRGNAGGLLTAAVDTCDMFLDRGLIVSTQGRGGVERNREMADPGMELPADVPIVILIDKLSASASEIVAACLQDHRRATIAGQRSWGKGTVQNVIYLPVDGELSALRLTVGRYLRPSGVEIHKRKDATEDDPWGVRPLDELTVHPTNEQYQAFTLARRKRDLLTWDELVAARDNRLTPEDQASPPPGDASSSGSESGHLENTSAKDSSAKNGSSDDNDSSENGEPPPSSSDVVPAFQLPPTPMPEPEDKRAAAEELAPKNALLNPTLVDPQLAKAVEYLRERIAREGRPGKRS